MQNTSQPISPILHEILQAIYDKLLVNEDLELTAQPRLPDDIISELELKFRDHHAWLNQLGPCLPKTHNASINIEYDKTYNILRIQVAHWLNQLESRKTWETWPDEPLEFPGEPMEVADIFAIKARRELIIPDDAMTIKFEINLNSLKLTPITVPQPVSQLHNPTFRPGLVYMLMAIHKLSKEQSSIQIANIGLLPIEIMRHIGSFYQVDNTDFFPQEELAHPLEVLALDTRQFDGLQFTGKIRDNSMMYMLLARQHKCAELEKKGDAIQGQQHYIESIPIEVMKHICTFVHNPVVKLSYPQLFMSRLIEQMVADETTKHHGRKRKKRVPPNDLSEMYVPKVKP